MDGVGGWVSCVAGWVMMWVGGWVGEVAGWVGWGRARWLAGWLDTKQWTSGSRAHCYPQGKRIPFESIEKNARRNAPQNVIPIIVPKENKTTKCGAFPRTENGRKKIKMKL